MQATGRPRWRRWAGAVGAELRSRPMAYGVLAAFVIAGPILTPLVFPEAHPVVGWLGGLAFGAYAALCAVPDKFL